MYKPRIADRLLARKLAGKGAVLIVCHWFLSLRHSWFLSLRQSIKGFLRVAGFPASPQV